jgi:6-phosphogluconolactonase
MEPETTSERERIIFENLRSLSLDAAYRFTALAAHSQVIGRPFTVALAGGSTPKSLYRLLTTSPFRETIPWQNTHLFFGDERCVPPDAPESNYGMVKAALLAPLGLPEQNIHRMPGERPDPDEAAREYEAQLHSFFGLAEGALPRFDLILLGLGPDGHCASLFPHKPALQERKRLVVASEPGLEPFVTRLTLTLPVLNHAAQLLFLVAGANKAETLVRVLNGPRDPETLPAQAIAPANGTLSWLVDREAARLLIAAQ